MSRREENPTTAPHPLAALALAALLGLAVAAPFVRPGRRYLAAGIGAAVAGLTAQLLLGSPALSLAAKALGAALAALGPGAGAERALRSDAALGLRRAGAPLAPGATRSRRLPLSGVRLDAADRLVLERAVLEAEADGGALALLVTSACGAYGGAGWRCGALLAALALLGGAVLGAELDATAAAASAGVALLAGHALARAPRVRRLFVSDAALEAQAARRAAGAHAELGLGDTDVLLLFARFEQRGVVRAGEVLATRPGGPTALEAPLDAAAARLDTGFPEALTAAVAASHGLLAGAPPRAAAAALRPRIVVED